jgi:hypothetical protein
MNTPGDARLKPAWNAGDCLTGMKYRHCDFFAVIE